MFSVGESYERFMGRWSRLLAPLLVQFAGVRDGDDVLDIGSGTGALADAVATAGPSSHVVGIDRSEPYVAIARARHQTMRVRFEVGDAQYLQFDSGRFDRTLSLLILNFIPDPEKALNEMIRVTRQNGTIASAVWDYGEGMEMLRAFWDEAVALVPDADARDERHMPFSRRGALATLCRLLGGGADRPIALRARAWAVRGVVGPHSRSSSKFRRRPHAGADAASSTSQLCNRRVASK